MSAVLKREFGGIAPVAITGGTVAHLVIGRADAEWVGHMLTGDAVPAMPESRVALRPSEIYQGLDPSAEA